MIRFKEVKRNTKIGTKICVKCGAELIPREGYWCRLCEASHLEESEIGKEMVKIMVNILKKSVQNVVTVIKLDLQMINDILVLSLHLSRSLISIMFCYLFSSFLSAC